jgi:DNA polymerase V
VACRADVREAVSSYTTLLGDLLRREHQVAASVSVMLWTKYDKHTHRQYCNTHTVIAPVATHQTHALLQLAHQALDAIFLRGYQYARVRVVLGGLTSDRELLNTLFDQPDEKIAQVTAAMDLINARYGRRTIFYASEGIRQAWHARRDSLSEAYTTNLHQLPVVHSSPYDYAVIPA